MASNTKYILKVAGEATDFVRSTKATVIAEAERVRKDGERALIEVVTGLGHVAFTLKESKARVVTFHTKPYTKTIALPAELAALMPAKYVPAYERPRNNAVVGRDMETVADERYVVVERTTGKVVGYAPTTRDAGQIMKGMKVAKVA